MDDLNAFLIEENTIALNRIIELKEKIRSIEYDIQFVNKAAQNMDNAKDKTFDLFSVEESDDTFVSSEYNSLIEKKNTLEQSRKIYLEELAVVNKRYEKTRILVENFANHLEECGQYSLNRQIRMDEINDDEMFKKNISVVMKNNIVHGMTSILKMNDLLIGIIKTDPQRAIVEINNNSRLIRNNIEDINNIIGKLCPISLEEDGLESTFISMMERIEDDIDIEFNYSYKGENLRDDYLFLVNVLRIIEESLNSFINKSECNSIVVDIEVFKKKVKVILKYNGINLDNKELNDNKGLAVITDRVNLFNGNIEIRSDKDEIQYSILFPLKKKSSN